MNTKIIATFFKISLGNYFKLNIPLNRHEKFN